MGFVVCDAEEIAIWRYLVDEENGRLLACAAADCDARDVAAVALLRKRGSEEQVRLALELADARRRARAKFPDRVAKHIIADRAGIEMASSQLTGDYKAQRLARVVEPDEGCIHDLCCGIGADAMSFANRGFDTIAVERNPLRAWMTKRNAGCLVLTGDVTEYDLSRIDSREKQYFHLDPSRRSEGVAGSGKRVWKFADYEPGPDFIREIITHKNLCGAIKLGPGVDVDDLDSIEGESARELEFISEGANRRLTQAVMWTGELVTTRRRATLLPSGETLSGNDIFNQPPIARKTDSYLFTIDAAVERAGLLAELCAQTNLPLIHPKLGLLTGARASNNPWLVSAFAVIMEIPYHERKVKRWLREHHAGIVTIKTRDKVVDTDRLQREWRGKGNEAFTVFVLRFDSAIRAIITERVSGLQRSCQHG